MIDLSVIIPFRDAAATLPRCLDALRAQEFPASRFEIIAIDNNSKLPGKCPRRVRRRVAGQ